MGIKRFEDVKTWQESRILARMIHEVSNEGDFVETTIYGIKSKQPQCQ